MKGLLVLLILPLSQCQLTTKHVTASNCSSEPSTLRDELKQELQRSNSKLERALNLLNVTLSSQIQKEATKLEHVEKNLNLHNESLGRIDVEMNELRNEKGTKVASVFMAKTLSRSGIYSTGEKLAFPTVVHNEGGHYNNITGEYSCPLTGLYFFSYCLYGYKLRDAHTAKVSVGLKISYTLQASVFVAYSDVDDLYVTISQSLVVQCNAGKRVWLEVLNDHVKLLSYNYRNLFSGFLITAN